MIFDWLPINKDTSWTGTGVGRGWVVQMCLFWCVDVCVSVSARRKRIGGGVEGGGGVGLLGWDIKRNQWLPWEITARVCILNIPVKYQ